MRKYESYKDSGIEWIGEIPKGWNVKRIKYIATCNDDVLPECTDKEKEINYVEIGDVINGVGITNSTKYKFGEAPSRARRITKEGDIIISTVRTYLRAIARINKDNFIVSTGFAVIRPKDINPVFLAFALQSSPFIEKVVSLSTGVSYPAINASQIVNISIVIPPNQEQLAIAKFLNMKTLEIDKQISERKKKIQLLEELKSSVISHAVTKGVNPNAKIKSSNIDWIGDVPEGWSYCRLKNFLSMRSEIAASDLPKIGLENIESRTGKLIPSSSIFNGNGVKFEKNDIVYGKLRPYLQKVWLAEFTGNAVGDFYVFKVKKNAYPVFCKFLLLSDCFTKVANGSTYGTKMPRVSSDFVLTLQYYLPPLNEQIAISHYLEKKTHEIESEQAIQQREISLLREYKQSLITEVVTGNRKVI